MPSLEDVRKWLEGHSVKGLPSRVPIWNPYSKKKRSKTSEGGASLDVEEGSSVVPGDTKKKGKKDTPLARKMRHIKAKKDTRFAINADGEDAVLHFGKHSGESISSLVKADPGYLKWMIKEKGFGDNIKDIITFQTKLRVEAVEKKRKVRSTLKGAKGATVEDLTIAIEKRHRTRKDPESDIEDDIIF